MTLQEVKQFLRDNAEKDAEVKAYLSDLSKVSPDQEEQIIRNYKTSQDFKSEIDRNITRAITTYNEKTVPTLIDKAKKEKEQELIDKYEPKKNPEKEQWQRELEKTNAKLAESERKIAERDKKMILKEVNNKKLLLLEKNKLPAEWANSIYVNTDNLTSDDIEDETKTTELIMSSIKPFADYMLEYGKGQRISQANDMLMGSAIKPGNSNSATSAGQLTEEQYKALPHNERMKAQKEGRVNQILGRQ